MSPFDCHSFARLALVGLNMTQAQIRFSTDILSRLGEELNPSPDQGIIELIKNAYDANARKCTVRLIGTSELGGAIEITDTGDGMDANDIVGNWLVLGRSQKSKSQRTRLNRIPAGSKGLGRLAALRMGKRASLVTRPRGDKQSEYSLTIDWEEYGKATIVEDVVLDVRHSKRDSGKKNGTVILLSDLNVRLSRWDVKRLARAMILLADPFREDPEGFQPILEAPEYKDLEKLVSNRYFEEADYHLSAVVDEDGRVSARVLDWKGGVLFEAGHSEIAVSSGGASYSCPPATFDLWVFVLNKASFEPKSVSLAEVKNWLQSFGGIHLYENGLRVQPYGNPGNDWLDMNLRRVRSPEERPGTNTSIGRVSVTDTEGFLIQKTDRSGFIESEAFNGLRKFAQDALDWMAKCRLVEAEKRRAQERKDADKKSEKSRIQVESAIDKVSGSVKGEIKKAFDARERSHKRQVDQLKKEIQLYRTLSTAGIMAATFAHESSGNPLKVVTNAIGAIDRRAGKELSQEKYKRWFKRPIDSIRAAVDSLSVLGSTTLRLLDHSKRRIGRVDLHRVFNNILETFKPFLVDREVQVEISYAEGSPYLKGAEAAVESILTNLINNSLIAFERAGIADRRIKIKTVVDGDQVTITVSDTGPGIEGIAKRYIWLPGQTTQPNGTGLGLTIVHDAVKDLGGSVDAVEHGQLGGADIIVNLPILGV